MSFLLYFVFDLVALPFPFSLALKISPLQQTTHPCILSSSRCKTFPCLVCRLFCCLTAYLISRLHPRISRTSHSHIFTPSWRAAGTTCICICQVQSLTVCFNCSMQKDFRTQTVNICKDLADPKHTPLQHPAARQPSWRPRTLTLRSRLRALRLSALKWAAWICPQSG